MYSTIQRLACVAFLVCPLGCDTSVEEQPPREQQLLLDQPSLTQALLDERGALTYVARSYDASGAGGSPTQVQGLIMVRDSAEYVSLGGPYYRDDLGNLIRLGRFQARQYGGRADFAITYLHNGGMQLAIDFRRDRVVDALIEVTPTGRYGIFIDPELQEIIDCFVALTTAGENPLDAVNACVGRTDGEGESEGGAGMAPSGEYDRLSDPDCGAATGEPGTGGPNGVAQQGGTQSESDWRRLDSISMPSPDGTVTSTVTFYERRNSEPGLPPDSRYTFTSRHRVTGDYTERSESIDRIAGRGSSTSILSFSRRTQDDGTIVYKSSMYINGREMWNDTWTIDPETGECTGDCPEPDPATRPEGDSPTDADGEDEPADPPTTEESAGTDQPGPECMFDGTCPVKDPRCDAPRTDVESMWDCVARTGLSPLQCLARLQDAVFASTGCVLVPGPAGQQVRDCPKSPSTAFTRCLQEGGSVYECLQRTIRDAGGEEIGSDENDDLLAPFRGVGGSGIDYLQTSEFGAIFFAFCAEGVEHFCQRNPGVF